MNRRRLLLGTAALLATPHAHAQSRPRKLPPRDESAGDPILRKTVETLRAACRAKSVDQLKPLLADDIKESFGGDGSPEQFLDAFKKKPALWQELDTCFALGGTMMGRGTFAAPYVYSAFPENLEGTDWLVVLGANVPVHETPRDTGVVAARLTHDIVRRSSPEMGVRVPPDWVRIRPPIGVPAYIRRNQVRSPIDYRAVLDKRDERWLLTALVAGD
jgi:hypothetical protein